MTYEPIKEGDVIYGIPYPWEKSVTSCVVGKVSPKTFKVGRELHKRVTAADGLGDGAVSVHWRTVYYRSEREAILAYAALCERSARQHEKDAAKARTDASEWRARALEADQTGGE